MNERDKELAKQAGDYVNKVYTPPVRSKTPGKIWEDGHVGWHTQFNAKFADLIRADEREALIRYFDGHWRRDWSDGQIIEALEARGKT
jgi:hypothetical protein